jgi:hypothetical protein
MFIQKAALVTLFVTGGIGVAAFAPPKQLIHQRCKANLLTRPSATAEKDDAAVDAPDHMPELRDIAPTFDAKTSNTAFERYKSDYARSLSSNVQYWNERAQSLLSWDHYPFSSESCEGVVTGGFEHGDVAWFPGAKLNVCYNAIDRHVQNGKADQVAMVSSSEISSLTYCL